MAALILTLVLAFIMAGALWLTLGSRFEFAAEGSENDLANLVVYSLGSIPVSFVIVFFGIGG
ncbi:MAG TPA: hypothetical protein DE147_08070 [Gammaproteobacteria bacterium]|nr:hypothetical protein [Gammaproteobacteria bacterium]HCG70402.1 hypothetical protein [Gammaproteobacteria bacterium]